MVIVRSSVQGSERERLETVAPFVYAGHNIYEFVCDLQRLVEASPDGVSAVVGKMIEKRIPDYDYPDALKKLLHTLVEKGKRHDVISYTERMRLLPGMQEIFDSLTRASHSSRRPYQRIPIACGGLQQHGADGDNESPHKIRRLSPLDKNRDQVCQKTARKRGKALLVWPSRNTCFRNGESSAPSHAVSMNCGGPWRGVFGRPSVLGAT